MPSQPRLILHNSVALITGAAGGIGAALALNLARRGCHLAITDRLSEPLAVTAQQARAAGVKVSEHVFDMADAAAVAGLPEQVRAAHGRLNVLINCAGVSLTGFLEHTSLDEFDWLMQINFWAVVRMMKAFLPILSEASQAQIVNISSVFGLIGPPGQSAYAASKFAVRGVSEALRHELEMNGAHIGVTVVNPAGIRTGIAVNTRLAAGMPKEERTRIEADQREGTWKKYLKMPPEEAAETIITGIERRKKRILCGANSHMIDVMQRLLPVNYWKLFPKPPRAK